MQIVPETQKKTLDEIHILIMGDNTYKGKQGSELFENYFLIDTRQDFFKLFRLCGFLIFPTINQQFSAPLSFKSVLLETG